MGTDRYGSLRKNEGSGTDNLTSAVFFTSHLRMKSNNAISVPIRTYLYLSVFYIGFLSAARVGVSNVER